MKRRLLPPAIGFAYIAVIGVLGGLRSDHVFAGCRAAHLYNEKSRLFLTRSFPSSPPAHLRLDALLLLCRQSRGACTWRGLTCSSATGRNRRPDPERSGSTSTPTRCSIACGFAYLVFVGEYLAVAFLLFFRRRFDVLRTFALCFSWSTCSLHHLLRYPVGLLVREQLRLRPGAHGRSFRRAAASRFDQCSGSLFDKI